MFLLPRLAGNVDSKDSRMMGLFISRTKLCFWRQKEKWSTLYHVKANENFAKNKSKTKKFPLTWYINCSRWIQLWEVILISELLGILRVASKGKITILILILRASDHCLPCFWRFSNFLNNQLNISDLLNPVVILKSANF